MALSQIIAKITPLVFVRRLTHEKVQSQGMPLAAAVSTMRKHLPHSAILVGQGIGQDVTWLGLVEGQDFEVHAFTIPTLKYRTPCATHTRYDFSQSLRQLMPTVRGAFGANQSMKAPVHSQK